VGSTVWLIDVKVCPCCSPAPACLASTCIVVRALCADLDELCNGAGSLLTHSRALSASESGKDCISPGTRKAKSFIPLRIHSMSVTISMPSQRVTPYTDLEILQHGLRQRSVRRCTVQRLLPPQRFSKRPERSVKRMR